MNGIAGRIAAASLAVALAVAVILGLGVFVFSAVAFERLMVEHGSTVGDAHAMFDESIARSFVGALVVATVASVGLQEVDRLVRLARSLDDLAAGDLATSPPTLTDIDLAAAITRAVELARPSLERRKVAAAIDVPAGLAARANPDHLAQVLANLLQNAGRYTPEGGAVTVTAARRPADVVVSVTNTGQAIPSAELPHLFERFYRVERSRSAELGGAGIGLAITKRLVELGGGQVGAESGPGQTRVWFSLPA